MKTSAPIKRYALIAFLTVLFILGVSIAFLTYRYYSVVARGILGIILIYLLYFFGKHSEMDITIDKMLSDPKKGKYLISAFVVPIISYWATIQLVEMVLFFWKR